MKISPFLLAASILLAIAFAISCSSDDGENDGGETAGGGNSSSSFDVSGWSTQLYFDSSEGEEYRGNGDIVIIYDRWDENYENRLFLDTLFVGKIQNGQVALDLPEELDSKYLRLMGDPCSNEEYRSCVNNFSYPNDLTATYVPLNVIIPGKRCHYLRLYNPEGSAKGEADFTYFSKSGRIEGTATYIHDYGEGDEYVTLTQDLSVSKGLNILWTIIDWAGNVVNASISTNTTQAVKNSVKWEALCTDAN